MEIHFTWDVDNFSEIPEKWSEAWSSTLFPGKLNKRLTDTSWQMTLYPYGYDKFKREASFISDYVTLELELLKGGPQLGKVECQFSLVNPSNVKCFPARITYNQEVEKQQRITLVSRRDALGLLVDDKLKIHCCLGESPAEFLCPLEALRTSPAERTRLSGLWELYKEQNLVDLTLRVQDKEFKAHKNVLASQSAVFSAMFKHDLVEKNTDVVNLSDINSEVFEELLRFLYLGIVNNLDKHSLELLASAEKYDLRELKKLCEVSLMANLTPDSAMAIFQAAELHGASNLRDKTLYYIVCNIQAVRNSEGWKQFFGKTGDTEQILVRFFCDVLLAMTTTANE